MIIIQMLMIVLRLQFQSKFIQKQQKMISKCLKSVKLDISTQRFNCKAVSEAINEIVKNNIQNRSAKPKVTVILALGKNRLPNPASEIYVNKKLQVMPQLGIESELIRIDPSITKGQMLELIEKLNEDPQNTSTMIQLPFPPEYSFDIHQVINKIKKEKNIDGFSNILTEQPNFLNPKTLKPPTALGIVTLLNYYGIKTKGKKIVIVGKGALVGWPLMKILLNFPYYATVTACDIFTKNLKKFTKEADIITAACGAASCIKQQDIKENAILIDAGINEIKEEKGDSEKILQTSQPIKPSKRKIVGDICKRAYHKSKYYTPVPGGVGLLTVSSLAFNVLNSYLLQKDLPIINLQSQLKNKHKLDKFLARLESKSDSVKVLLISSAYNGLTQRVERTLKEKGYTVSFQTATSAQAMRSAVGEFGPDVIVCPTLMKAIPEDIYKRVKCLIVHPGIKGDRGPSSIDWAILKEEKEWGVTILEANQEMDAGDIWATENFKLNLGQSKVQVYNKSVCSIAERLILQSLLNFSDPAFKPQKLDYNNPLIKGQLHRTIKLSDSERTVDWQSETTQNIIKKALAAETQPGLKVNLTIGDRKITRFTYGYTKETEIIPPSHIKNGEIFLTKMEAVCVKTVDGAVWIRSMRHLKSKETPLPFKVPSTIHLGAQTLKGIPEIKSQSIEAPNSNTFQEITFEQKGQIGVLGFDFYNGAMSTAQCLRLNQTLKKVSENKEVKVLILEGSERNWSNGIHLNVIENAEDPKIEGMNNIKAINQVVKSIYGMNDKLTISAMQANAGAGGVYLGLATDITFAKEGIVMNPHYKKMGLFGSELHTATAARKFGFTILRHMTRKAEPMIVSEGLELNILNRLQLKEGEGFMEGVLRYAGTQLEDRDQFQRILAQNCEERKMLFRVKTLEQFEREELSEMEKDIMQDRNHFSQKRWEFVRKQQSK